MEIPKAHSQTLKKQKVDHDELIAAEKRKFAFVQEIILSDDVESLKTRHTDFESLTSKDVENIILFLKQRVRTTTMLYLKDRTHFVEKIESEMEKAFLLRDSIKEFKQKTFNLEVTIRKLRFELLKYQEHASFNQDPEDTQTELIPPLEEKED